MYGPVEVFNPSFADAMRLLSKTNLKEFSLDDFDNWPGTESNDPLIGRSVSRCVTVILDGDVLGVYHEASSVWRHFRLNGEQIWF